MGNAIARFADPYLQASGLHIRTYTHGTSSSRRAAAKYFRGVPMSVVKAGLYALNSTTCQAPRHW